MEWLQALLFGEDSTRSTRSSNRSRRDARRKRRRRTGSTDRLTPAVVSPTAKKLEDLEARNQALQARVDELEAMRFADQAWRREVEQHQAAWSDRMAALRVALSEFSRPIQIVSEQKAGTDAPDHQDPGADAQDAAFPPRTNGVAANGHPPTRPHFPSTMALVDRA